MLKFRVIVALCYREGVLFRTKLFQPDYRYTSNFLALANADEACMIDVTAAPGDQAAFAAVVERYSGESFLPVTAGGHVETATRFDDLLRRHGADKVLLGSAAVRRPEFIAGSARRYGNQACVLGVAHDDEGHVYCGSGREKTTRKAWDWAAEAVALGAGEIVLSSVERDGSLEGYDLATLGRVCQAVPVPVIPLGGCGRWAHMREAYLAGAHGAATNCIFHYTDTALAGCKQWLAGNGVPVRPAA